MTLRRMTALRSLVYSAVMKFSLLRSVGSADDQQHARTTAASDPGSLAVARWQPFRGPFQRWPRFMDTLLALVAFLFTLMMWSGGEEPELPIGGADIFALMLAIVGNFALIWRRRLPLQVHGVVLACSAAVFFATSHDGLVAMSFSLYAVGRYAAHDRASILGMLMGVFLASVDMFELHSSQPGSFVALGLVVLFWYFGRRVRFRGEYLRLLEERASYLEQRKAEEADRAVAEERTRIARELHDIVAHQVSLMTVQAGAAKTVASTDPQAALGAMAAVEHAGRQAMSEMRHLLDVLRQDKTGAQTVPQPGCADLVSLAAEVRAAGNPVSLVTEGRLSGMPAMLDLAAYRIVQEALTNVIKHAGPGAGAEVRLRATGDALEIRVADRGERKAGTPGKGYGIAGMRERAELLGGWLKAGPINDQGFEVQAYLPRQQVKNAVPHQPQEHRL